MRIYIKKYGKKGIMVYKETLLQSIISDLISFIVILLLFGFDILFSIYVTHSIVIDIAVVLLFFGYLQSFQGFKHNITDVKNIGEKVESLLKD